jgi:hypothetical protein
MIMKKIFAQLATFTALLFALGYSSQGLKAQCGAYTITNPSNCMAIINYNFACSGGPSCASASGVTLLEMNASGPISLGACSCASGKCALTVTLVQIGTFVLPTPITVGPSNTSATFTKPCPNSPGSIVWTSSTVTIF